MISINSSDIKINRVDIYQVDGTAIKGCLQINDVEAIEKNNNGILPKFIIVAYEVHHYDPDHYTTTEEVVLSWRASKTGNKGFYKQVTPNERTLGYVAIDDSRAQQLVNAITKQTSKTVATSKPTTTPTTPAFKPFSLKPTTLPVNNIINDKDEDELFL
jgi:hypothetical protein